MSCDWSENKTPPKTNKQIRYQLLDSFSKELLITPLFT